MAEPSFLRDVTNAILSEPFVNFDDEVKKHEAVREMKLGWMIVSKSTTILSSFTEDEGEKAMQTMQSMKKFFSSDKSRKTVKTIEKKAIENEEKKAIENEEKKEQRKKARKQAHAQKEQLINDFVLEVFRVEKTAEQMPLLFSLARSLIQNRASELKAKGQNTNVIKRQRPEKKVGDEKKKAIKKIRKNLLS